MNYEYYKFSPSTLSIWASCKLCFWRHINQGIPRPRGIFASLPGGMDLVLKHICNTYRVKGVLPPFLANHIEGKLAKISLNLSYLIPDANIKIIGKLDDCLELEDKIFVPLDHKTKGSSPRNEEYSYNYYLNQMSTYTLLLRENGYATNNEAFLIYYSPDIGEFDKGFPFKITVHKIQTQPDEVLNQYLEAKKCIEGPIPEASPDCEYCRYIERIAREKNI